MRVDYDRSFAPYVIPAGSPVGREARPDARWARVMALGQARGLVTELLVRLRARLPFDAPALDGLHARLVPAAGGHVPVAGDAELAWHRFAGTNPLLVRRVRDLSEVPATLRLHDGLFEKIMGGGSAFTQRMNRPSSSPGSCRALARRVADGDVFIVRHDVLRVRAERDLQPGKFVAPTISLFCHAPEMDSPFPVVPLAIECPVGRADGETSVFTPMSEQRWRAAKQLVGVADIHVAELWLHLARAHFMTVPFAIALHRRLPTSHALFAFLSPHLRFNLFVDRMAWTQGVSETSGVLIRSLAGSAEWSREVARTLYYEASFREQHFERDLAARGLDSHPVEYPYRDDGRLLWAAIERFVASYVDLAYPEESDLAADADVHAFLGEVADPQGGNVRGLFAEGRRVASKDELTQILTQVIFVAGPLHALAHYSSAAQLQYVDESPSWLTGNPLSMSEDTSPGPVVAMHQLTRVIGTNCRHDSLGDFSQHALGRREDCRAVVAAFQSDLASVERAIEARNARRFLPFLHFLPSRIPNGITV